jgi:DNA-binding CsgD family transcriptional regulator
VEARRAKGIKRRKAWVHERVQEPVNLPIALEEFMSGHPGVFTPLQTQALVWRYGHGLSLQETADELGIRKSTVRGRLRRAMQKLPEELQDMDHRDLGWLDAQEQRKVEFEVEENEREKLRIEGRQKDWEDRHPEKYDPVTGGFLS